MRSPAPTRLVVRLTPAAAAALALVLAPGAAGKAMKGNATDPAGDATSPAFDITKATATYDRVGSLRISVTTAADLSLTGGNQLVVTFAGAGCDTDLFGAAADLRTPTRPWTYRLRGAGAEAVGGSGTVRGKRYTATFRTKQIAKLRPVYFQAAIFPSNDKLDALDQTDCTLLK